MALMSAAAATGVELEREERKSAQRVKVLK
jgi:hypothetical protein